MASIKEHYEMSTSARSVAEHLVFAGLVIVKDTLQNGLATLVARRSNFS